MKIKQTIIIFVFLLPLILIGLVTYDNFNQSIDRVVINGEFNYLSERDVIDLIDENVQTGFLTLNLPDLNRKIVEQDWIRSSSIRRSWPATLIVNIEEEIPVARWGEQQILNNVGDYIDVINKDSVSHLPVIFSQAGDTKEIIKIYQLISELLGPVGLRIDEVESDNAGSWTLTVLSDIKIILGRDQLVEKLQRLQSVWLAELSSQEKNINVIDLRYPNGLAVKWKQNTRS
jgi:cell division protein FtsQ